LIEWIVWRVDTGVKKKLLMRRMAYAKAARQRINIFVYNKSASGKPLVRAADFRDFPTLFEVAFDSKFHIPRRAATGLGQRRSAAKG